MNTCSRITLISILICTTALYKANAQIFMEIQKDTIVNFYDRKRYIEIDSSIQYLHQDSINIIKSKIKGVWHYQGKLEGDKVVADTLSWEDGRIFFVRNGIIYQSRNGIETKTNEIDLSSFDNDGLIGFHTRTNGFTYEVRTCQPIYEIVYHNNSIGLYSISNFRPIKYLDDKFLVIETETEFGFEYISNDYSPIKIKKEFQYFVRKQ